jgi:RimJ/RimL family protein N-acetyltransferase
MGDMGDAGDAGDRLESLRDGRTVRIRALTGSDARALREAVGRADHDDLHRRFMGTPPPSSELIRLLAAADGVHDAALGAFDAEERLIGVAQFDRVDEEPTAELAIEVAHDWQRTGLGSALLRELGVLAAAVGIRRLTAVYFSDNTAIMRLLHDTGCARWVDSRGGASTAELDVNRMVATAVEI